MAGDFVLNTENMDEAAKGCQTLAEKMQDLKDKIGNLQSDLAFCWDGKGHNAFQKQYRLLTQQLADITDNLWQTAENILTAEESYIQTDTEAAQKLDGIQQGVGVDADETIKGIKIQN